MKKIYTNGTILTMDKKQGNALVVEDNIIIGIGDFHQLYKENMQVIDLHGYTLMPSFIDAHSHLSGYANGLLQVALDECQSIQDIQNVIVEHIKNNPQVKNIKCKGYDHHKLKEKRHITKRELDCMTSIPIFIQHQTGHCGVMNTEAFQFLGIDEKTPSPAGGKINFETGFLEENAFTYYIQKAPMPTLQELKEAYKKAQDIYASYGITTIQDGMLVDALKNIYTMLMNEDVFYLDVVGYVGFDEKEWKNELKDNNNYKHHFKLGGYKMFLDGSPQNKTAWVTEPYTDGTYGYPTLTDRQIQNYLKKAIDENKQVLAHCNGDRAIQHYIDQYELVHQQDIRPVIVHAQMLRKDQMKKVKQLKMIPSFFLSHVYYFGDIHKENMSKNRAENISPLMTSLQHNILFTLHQDAPVIEPNMFETLHIAVNRTTQKGYVLGQKECISVEEAIKAITINAAYQYFEEDFKGTLTVGKKADMIIVSENPLTCQNDKIKDIQVLQTIKDGKVIYER